MDKRHRLRTKDDKNNLIADIMKGVKLSTGYRKVRKNNVTDKRQDLTIYKRSGIPTLGVDGLGKWMVQMWKTTSAQSQGGADDVVQMVGARKGADRIDRGLRETHLPITQPTYG